MSGPGELSSRSGRRPPRRPNHHHLSRPLRCPLSPSLLPTMSKHLSSPADLKEMLAGVDTILLDCDGVSSSLSSSSSSHPPRRFLADLPRPRACQVLWHGDKILPNIKETLEYFRSLGESP